MCEKASYSGRYHLRERLSLAAADSVRFDGADAKLKPESFLIVDGGRGVQYKCWAASAAEWRGVGKEVRGASIVWKAGM